MKRTVIILSLIFALAIAVSVAIPALAASSGSTTVTGSLAGTIDVTAPATQSIALVPDTSPSSSPTTIGIRCNKIGWGLTCYVNTSTMKSASTPADVLGQPLYITVGSIVSNQSIGLSTSPLTIVTAGATAPSNTKGSGLMNTGYSITFQQPTSYADTAHTDYVILVTFVGAPN
jgi:hypothetical protein